MKLFIILYFLMSFTLVSNATDEENFESDVESNKDYSERYSFYIINLHLKKAIDFSEFQNAFNEIKSNRLDNPFNCKINFQSFICKNSVLQLHSIALQKMARKKSIDKERVIQYLQKYEDEINELNNSKNKAQEEKKSLDKISFFKIEPEEHIVFSEPVLNDTNKSVRFVTRKIDHDILFSDRLVNQKFFSYVMNFNPSLFISESRKQILKTESGTIEYDPISPVNNVSESELYEFLNTLNYKISKREFDFKEYFSQNHSNCNIDIPTQEEYDSIKYYYFKDLKFKSKNFPTIKKLSDFNNLSVSEIENGKVIFAISNLHYKNEELFFEFYSPSDYSIKHWKSKISEENNSIDFSAYYKKLKDSYFETENNNNKTSFYKEFINFKDSLTRIQGNNFYSIIGGKRIFIKNKKYNVLTYDGADYMTVSSFTDALFGQNAYNHEKFFNYNFVPFIYDNYSFLSQHFFHNSKFHYSGSYYEFPSERAPFEVERSPSIGIRLVLRCEKNK